MNDGHVNDIRVTNIPFKFRSCLLNVAYIQLPVLERLDLKQFTTR